MQAIVEPVFEIPYLITVVALGLLMLRMAKGDRQIALFGIMSVVLGCGDAFHLVPRMYALLTDGIENHAASLGFGKLVTSITMTIFYILLYHIWQRRYNKTNSGALTAAVYALSAARIILCLMPQNDWLSADSPLAWGVYRNIPFVILGAALIVLYFREAKKSKDREFDLMWLAITLSFVFYIPVVLWADLVPIIGMLMLPKTCAYVWIVWMGYASAKRKAKINSTAL